MRAAARIAVFALLGACTLVDEPALDDGDGRGGKADDPTRLRIGQYNIRELTTAKLLDANNRQVKSAAQVISRFDADILSINEIQYDLKGVPEASLPGATDDALGALAINGAPAGNAKRLAARIKAVDANLDYKYTAMFLGNSGFAFAGETGGHDELAMRGFGEWRGHFNSALLSRHEILVDDVRVLHDYPWRKVPGNSVGEIETTLGIAIPADFPIFEKALFVVPVKLDTGAVIHFVLAHPVSSGFNAMNPYRNRDELRAIGLFLSGELPDVEPLPDDAHFVVIGDLNSDPEDGEGGGGIHTLLEHPLIEAHFPEGRGGTGGMHPERNTFLSGCGRDTVVTNPASKLQLQLDYLLPSTTLGEVQGSSVFWPNQTENPNLYAMTCYASDHRYVYIDLPRP